MTLVRFNQTQLDDVFSKGTWLDSFLDNNFACEETPNYVINDNELDVELEMPVPGLTKEDLEIVLENEFVTIKTVDNESERKSNWTQAFDKKFKLSDKINSEDIKAVVENGVLKINFPKAAETLKKPARSINIS